MTHVQIIEPAMGENWSLHAAEIQENTVYSQQENTSRSRNPYVFPVHWGC